MKPVVDLVAGARPNFMKLAPVVRALACHQDIEFRIVHTGQHYDEAMTDVFFQELAIPAPHAHLEVGSGTQAAQTARILERYEAHLDKSRPNGTVVFGDVNSTVACALAAVKLQVPVAHVEAGLRSFDRTMPEEINRVLTDAIADLLLASEPAGMANLGREGVPPERIRLVGNVMIDTLMWQLPRARERATAERLGLRPKQYAFLTLHRPSNVDDPATLARLVALFEELSARLPIVFPVHPRTLNVARTAGFGHKLTTGNGRLMCSGPIAYLDTLSLVETAAVVLTDSGGLQEEASVLRVPCITLRDRTERPITIELGTSRLVGNDVERIRASFEAAVSGAWPSGQDIPFWDGHAAERVAGALIRWLAR